MKKVLVTTSWDDGHILDMRLASILKKYGISGTFYVSPKDREFMPEQLLTDEQIKELSKEFEIGAHTMTHPHLTDLSDEHALQEIAGSKEYLERLLGKPVTSFCYPAGYYNPKHVGLQRYMHTATGLMHGQFYVQLE
jgi:peptidoglycan/xylan/chitin deacetylase (PgdA/CDA1 family)